MLLHVLIINTPDGNIDECNIFEERELASESLLFWAESNNIELDTDVTESEIYFDEDSEGEYISRIIDDNAGQALILSRELESY